MDNQSIVLPDKVPNLIELREDCKGKQDHRPAFLPLNLLSFSKKCDRC
ncbi:hypothetical protein [uncultured Turicimonas sp.]